MFYEDSFLLCKGCFELLINLLLIFIVMPGIYYLTGIGQYPVIGYGVEFTPYFYFCIAHD